MKPGSKKGWRSTVPLVSGDESMTNPVYLNVYDLTPMNNCFYWAGLGVFHTGVEGQLFLLILFFISYLDAPSSIMMLVDQTIVTYVQDQ